MANLIRWNPRNALDITDSLRGVEQFMDELWRDWPWSGRFFQPDMARPMLRPAMDVIENDVDLTIRVDLPGLKPDDVQVEVENGTLTLRGQMGDTIEKEDDHYYYRERSFGTFQRSLRLPDTLDTDKVDATFDNGVLTLVIPKLPQAQPRQIEVKKAKS
jgi:HSP20 family protein